LELDFLKFINDSIKSGTKTILALFFHVAFNVFE
jgi:hypothetical protein